MLSFKPVFFTHLFHFHEEALQFLFIFWYKGGVIYICEFTDISPSKLNSSLCFIQPGISHDVFCIEVKQAEWQYTALTYSFPNLESVCCSMSGSNCCFLIRRQISQEAGKVVWYSHLLKNLSQFVVICTVKSFGIVNKAKVDVYLELSCYFYDSTDVANLISGSSAFFKSSLNILKFLVHILMKPDLENFEHYFASLWFECNCVVVWAFFGIAFLWDWDENWPFPVLWPLLNFQICWHIQCRNLTASSFNLKWLSQNSSLPLALFEVMFSKAHLT